MKIRTLLLMLTLSLILAFPLALAEDVPFVPGEITSALFSEAYEAGETVLIDLNVFAAFTDGLAGDSPEDRAMLDAVSQTLDKATLTLGACRLEDGLRVELSAAYADEVAPVSLSAAINLTSEGVTLESDLIEGSKVTAKWETLLALAGLTGDQIDIAMSLSTMTPEELLAATAPVIESFGAMLAPYGETISGFIAELPMELREDVPAEADFPAVPQELIISFTDQDLAMLLHALASQLEADEALASLLDMLLVQLDDEALASTADLCAQLHALADEMDTWGDTYTVFIGMNEDGDFVYASAYAENADGSTLLAEFCMEPVGTEGSYSIWGDVVTLDEEQYIMDGFAFSVGCMMNPDLAQEGAVTVGLEVYDDGITILAAEVENTVTAFTTQDGQPGFSMDYTYNYGIAAEDASVNMVMMMNGEMVRTAEGGEISNFAGTIDVSEDGVLIPSTFSFTQQTLPTTDGPVCETTVSYSMPDIGFDPYGFTARMYTRAYDPSSTAALKEWSLETISSDEMDALMGAAYAAFMGKADALMTALPPEFVTLILSAE